MTSKSDNYTIYGNLGGFPSVGLFLHDKSWHTQEKPYVKPLPFALKKIFCGGNGSWSDVRSSVFDSRRVGWFDNELARATDKALSRLNESMHKIQAGMAINLVQWRQSTEMIVKRATQLGRAYRALRKGKLGSFLNEFGLTAKKKHVVLTRKGKRNRYSDAITVRPKDAPGLWLEYWFGWLPAIQDIYSCCEILQSNPPPMKVFGRGGSSYSKDGMYLDDAFRNHRVSGMVRVHIQTTVRLTNPNLYLANQLGLINPAAVLWDAIPFSFVVDWFVPVTKFLNSYTEYMGLSFEDIFQTTTWLGEDSGTAVYLWNGEPRLRQTYGIVINRVILPALPRRGLVPSTFKGFDFWKIATSAALISQIFK